MRFHLVCGTSFSWHETAHSIYNRATEGKWHQSLCYVTLQTTHGAQQNWGWWQTIPRRCFPCSYERDDKCWYFSGSEHSGSSWKFPYRDDVCVHCAFFFLAPATASASSMSLWAGRTSCPPSSLVRSTMPTDSVNWCLDRVPKFAPTW